MITRARFQNFKALRDVEVAFDSRLTVLVGPNGSGKTSVLQGIHFLTKLAREANADPDWQFQNTPEFFSTGQKLDHFLLQAEGKHGTDGGEYKIDIHLKGGIVHLQLTLPHTDGAQGEQIVAQGPLSNGRIAVSYRPGSRVEYPEGRFDYSALVSFNTKQLGAPVVVRSDLPQLGRDGAGLAATLVHIRNKDEELFRLIEQTFTRVIRGAKRIRFDSEQVPDSDGIFGHTLLIDFVGAEGVKARHLSSGTLFALGVLTVALGPDSPSIILLDDLDSGLHPKAQMELIDVFRIVLTRRPSLQIIATSHSPYILNPLQPNEVRVMALRDDGSADCAKLTDHPDFTRWNETMTPGEFWSHTGEKWVKTRPARPTESVAP